MMNWNGKLKRSSIQSSAVAGFSIKSAGRIFPHPTILGNPPATSPIRKISLMNSTLVIQTNRVLFLVLVPQVNLSISSLFSGQSLFVVCTWLSNISARRSSLPGREVLSGIRVMCTLISQLAASPNIVFSLLLCSVAFNLSNTKYPVSSFCSFKSDCSFQRTS
jgi:hypothetical protein